MLFSGSSLIGYQTESIVDTSREQLQTIQSTRTHPDPKVIKELQRRKLVSTQKVISFKVEKGPKFAAELVKEETDLTADLLARLETQPRSYDSLSLNVAVVHGRPPS